VGIQVEIYAHRVVLAVEQRHALAYLPVDHRLPIGEQRHVRIANPLAEDPFQRMPAAAQVVLQVERFHRGRPLVGRFVSFVAVEDLDKIELSLDLDVAHRPLEQENVLGVDDFETVLIGYST